MSLFGAPQVSASPFGNLGSASTTQQQANPFAKATSGNLFSNTPASTTGQPSGTNLFSNLATSQNQQAGGTPSLFGNLSQSNQSQQQASGPSLFGSQLRQQPALGTQTEQQATGLVPGTSLFGSTNGQNVQNTSAASATTALFQNLLERGKGRQTDVKGDLKIGELPSLKLGLSHIASKVRDLAATTSSPRGGTTSSSRAHYLLAASGVPRASTLRDLDDLGSLRESTTLPGGPIPAETDIDAYVNTLQAKSSAQLFQEYMAQTKRDFDAFVEDRFVVDQQEQRQRIYEHFGLSKPEDRSGTPNKHATSRAGRGAFGKSSQRVESNYQSSPGRISHGGQSLSRSVLGKPVGKGSFHGSVFSDVSERVNASSAAISSEDPSSRNKQTYYAAKVKELNLFRLQGKIYPIIEEFARVEVEAGEDVPQHLVDAFRALKKITGENAALQKPTDPGAIRERHYMKDYLDMSDSGKGLEMRKRVLAGSRAYLEDSFFSNLENVVGRNPREANLGGVPTKLNKVRAYVRVRAARKDLGVDEDVLQKIGDDFCWVLIFYLLRCGLVQEAAQYVADNETPIKIMDRGFATYMSLYSSDTERRLPAGYQQRIEQDYQFRLNSSPEKSIDPYRTACYKIIGRCDLGQKTLRDINTGLEDWLWVVLSLARETPRTDEVAGKSFGLDDVRVLIEQIGERHFQSGEDLAGGYATFFYLQVVVGMFEKAVAWLHAYNYVAAVHFAIALAYYGLLRVSDFAPDESRLLSQNNAQQPQISFDRMLGFYTQHFRLARPVDACDYLVQMCLNTDLPGPAGPAHAAVCHEALKELVLETREFTLLLGDVRADGIKFSGAISQRLELVSAGDNAEFLRSLTIQAAAVADDSGRTTDAVLLYHLAEEFDSVIVVINRALSDSISVELRREHMHLQPTKQTKPEGNQGQQQQQRQQQEINDSASLTSVDDPAVLARNLINLYNANAMYFRKIRQANRDACGILIRMSEVKARVEAGRWAEALDLIATLELLPLRAKGNVSVIRSAAQGFNALPQVVSRNIGNLLIWTITCLGKQREAIRNSAFQAQRPVADDLLVMAKDLMLFAGSVRYKLPQDVYDILAVGAN